MSTDKALIIGAGAWGSAIANLAARNCDQVLLLTNSPELASEINNQRTNSKHLPGVKIDERINAVSELTLSDVKSSNLIFIVTPASEVESMLFGLLKFQLSDDVGFILCSKGLAASSGKVRFFSQIHSEKFPHLNYAFLAGPNFASEVAMQVPTISTIASSKPKFANRVSAALQNENFKTEISTDPLAVEICGSIKNIIAIGCGMIDELALGDNAKAALVVKGIREILLLSAKLHANTNLALACGFGDIFLTCSSKNSRNNTLGRLLVQSKAPAQNFATVEGESSAHNITELSHKLDLKLSMCEMISRILTVRPSKDQIRSAIVEVILE